MITFATESVTVLFPEGQGNTTGGAARTVDIQPAKASIAWEQFGVEVSNPFLLFDEASASGYYVESGQVLWGDKVLVIKAPPAVWDALIDASNVCVLLQEQR